MPIDRRYRLTDAALQPHPHLDDEFASLPEALETGDGDSLEPIAGV